MATNMATNNVSSNESKAAGFFVGANDLAKYLVENGRALERASIAAEKEIIEIEGTNYCWNRESGKWEPIRLVTIVPEDDPVAPEYVFYTLDGLVDYIAENVEGLIPDVSQGRLILHVVDHTTVRLMSHPSKHRKQRHCIAKSCAHTPEISFGRYMDAETFNTQLLSKFIDTPPRAELFRVVKSMTREQACTTTDDGVSQVVTVKQGVSMAQNVTIKNPVALKPMRTFTEIDQPESNFTLRVDENANCALHEADGGAWKNAAVDRISDYLRKRLNDKNVSNVVVIA